MQSQCSRLFRFFQNLSRKIQDPDPDPRSESKWKSGFGSESNCFGSATLVNRNKKTLKHKKNKKNQQIGIIKTAWFECVPLKMLRSQFLLLFYSVWWIRNDLTRIWIRILLFILIRISDPGSFWTNSEKI